MGYGMDQIQDLMHSGLETKVFPGAVVLAAKGGDIVCHEAFGYARTSPNRLMTRDTIFDLASLTKPLATATSIMLLVQKKMIGLSDSIGKHMPIFRQSGKANITVRELLAHASGLPAHRPYYENLSHVPVSARASVLDLLLAGEPLCHPPGKTCLYSDLGFMVLGRLIESLTNAPLNKAVESLILKPINLSGLFFLPGNVSRQEIGLTYAATLDCPWRARVLEGEVHDENAYVLGGVAGHAGLFGTAAAVYSLLNELMEAYHAYNGRPGSGLFSQELTRTFFQKYSKDAGTWALGFDTPSRPGSSSGELFSDQSVGHLGYTGTSFWMDLDARVIVILLTNRLYYGTANEKMKAFRPQFHNRVMSAMAEF